MKKFRFTMAVLTGLAAFAFTAGAQAKIKLAVSHPPMGLHLLPVLVAEDRGFFAAEGLEIKHSFMAGGSAAAAAMIGGSVDATVGAMARAILLRAKGIKVKLLCGIAGIRDWSVVVNAKTRANVNSIKQLKGLKIATPRRGSDGDQIMRWILRSNGLKVGPDVQLIQIGGFQNHLIAIQKGDVDGAIMPEPFGTSGVATGATKKVLDLLKGEGPAILGNRLWSGLLVKDEYLAKHPEVAAKLTRALSKATKALYADHAMAVDVAAKRMPKIGKALLAKMIPDRLTSKKGMAYTMTITQGAVKAENEWFTKIGRLKREVSYDEVVAKGMSKHW